MIPVKCWGGFYRLLETGAWGKIQCILIHIQDSAGKRKAIRMPAYALTEKKKKICSEVYKEGKKLLCIGPSVAGWLTFPPPSLSRTFGESFRGGGFFFAGIMMNVS